MLRIICVLVASTILFEKMNIITSAQDCQSLWNQCQKYNTIALDAYKKCHGKLNILNEKFEEEKLNLNQTKIELHACQDSTSRYTLLVIIPWFLLGNFFCIKF